MRAAWYERNGPARDVLSVGVLPDPQPQAGEVLVRLRASGVNPSDAKGREGNRPMAASRVVPGRDSDWLGPLSSDAGPCQSHELCGQTCRTINA